MNHQLAPGLSGVAETEVTETNTALALGSGLVPVFATPALVALLERAAVQALSGCLEPGTTTVGTGIDVRHLAATPVGLLVQARATLVQIEGRRLVFHVSASDPVDVVAEGVHQRVVVDQVPFESRAREKARQSAR